jgi:hypothetical protein
VPEHVLLLCEGCLAKGQYHATSMQSSRQDDQRTSAFLAIGPVLQFVKSAFARLLNSMTRLGPTNDTPAG